MDDDTEAFFSCSSLLNGELFVFGGYSTKQKQVNFKSRTCSVIKLWFKVSKVIGCELKRIGDLSYEFYRGACGTFNFPEERIMLCFSSAHKSKCET